MTTTHVQEDLLGLVIGTLVTWRVSHLLVEEEGPGQLVTRLRAAVGATPLAGVLDCFGCTSIWVGAAVASVVAGPRATILDRAVGGLAVSGAAFLVQKMISRGEPSDWLPEPEHDSPLITVL
jgi:hypothetical protein